LGRTTRWEKSNSCSPTSTRFTCTILRQGSCSARRIGPSATAASAWRIPWNSRKFCLHPTGGIAVASRARSRRARRQPYSSQSRYRSCFFTGRQMSLRTALCTSTGMFIGAIRRSHRLLTVRSPSSEFFPPATLCERGPNDSAPRESLQSIYELQRLARSQRIRLNRIQRLPQCIRFFIRNLERQLRLRMLLPRRLLRLQHSQVLPRSLDHVPRYAGQRRYLQAITLVRRS